MEKLLNLIKSKLFEIATLFVVIVSLNSVGFFFLPFVTTSIIQQSTNPTMPLISWILALTFLMLAAIGTVILTVRISSLPNKTTLYMKILLMAFLFLFLHFALDYLIELCSKVIYNNIDGSIATVKIVFDSIATIIKVPIYAFLFYIFSNILNHQKVFHRKKRYLTLLLICLAVWIINFIFSLLPNGVFFTISQCIIIAFMLTGLITFLIYQKGELKNEVV